MHRSIFVSIALSSILLGVVGITVAVADAPTECVLTIPEPQRFWFCRGTRVGPPDAFVCQGTVEPGLVTTIGAGRVEFTDIPVADLHTGTVPILTCNGFFAGSGEPDAGEHCQFTCTP
jgi:hypothetical protein